MKILTDWMEKRRIRRSIDRLLSVSPEEVCIIEADENKSRTLLEIFEEAQRPDVKARYIICKLAGFDKNQE